MPHILIIDDDVELSEGLKTYLAMEHFQVSLCHRGDDAVQRLTNEVFDAVVLDVMLPGMNGFDVLRQTRSKTDVPILMLTAKGDDADSVLGLELGADDYLAKPTSPRVLLARLRALLRRTQINNTSTQQVIQAGCLYIDPSKREVRCADTLINLTGAEFHVLSCLANHPGIIVSKETLCETALGRELVPYDRSIDVHISNLRKKFSDTPNCIASIATIRGAGYQLITAVNA